MRKNFYATALLLFVIAALTACTVTITPKNKNAGGGRFSEQYAGYINSGAYYMKYTTDVQTGGQTIKTEVEAAVNGSDSAERSGFYPERLGIYKGSISYIVDYKAKSVTYYLRPLVLESASTFDFKGLAYMETGSMSDNGRDYVYDEYAADSGNHFRFCFDGDKLVGLQALSGDTVTAAITVLEFSDKIPSYMFTIPADFTQTRGD